MKNNAKLYVVFKESHNNDEYCDYCLIDTQILAICNSPQRALKILEDELAYCKKRGLTKRECSLYVEVFENLNQVSKKNKKIFNIFQFKKMIEALL